MPPSFQQIEKLRAWWWRRQGFGPEPRSELSPAAILTQAGWARSVGGCAPYLTFFSRAAISREAADLAVTNLEIHELPSVRGCTYVIPAGDFPLALYLAQNGRSGETRTAEKLGVSAREIDKLCQAVLAALEKSPLDPDAIREATGKAVRSLGPEGQKKGLSSTLPVALGLLQTTGDIRRIPSNGRLDQQRYKYTLWRPNPLLNVDLDPEHAARDLARRFFDWIAPARISDFQAFAGVGVKAAKTAVDSLKLEPLSKEDDRLLPPADRTAFDAFKPPKDPCYHLVISIDSLLLLRPDLTSLLNPADLKHPLVAPEFTSRIPVLPNPAIIDRGRVVGLWEYDPATESIAYTTFTKPDSLLKKAVARTEEYIRSQLGDARTFSLDSPKSRAPRIAALRN